MADVKWIKLDVNLFDNRKIKMLEALPDGYAMVVVWLKLLCLAGQTNDGGAVYFTKEIPYTEEMMATVFGMPIVIIRSALNYFEQFGMIERVNDIMYLSSWEKYQNIEGMDRIREQTRKRVADYRDRKKQEALLSAPDDSLCAYCGETADTVDHIIPRSKNGSNDASNLVPCCKSCNSSKKDKDLVDFLNDSFVYHYQGVDHERVRKNEKLMKHVYWDAVNNRYCNVTVTQGNAIEGDIEREEDKDIYILPSNEGNCGCVDSDVDVSVDIVHTHADTERIVRAWNSLGLGQVTKVTSSSKRGQMLKARLRDYGMDEVLRAIENVRQSDFLTGKSSEWVITFDWFVKPNNFPKVLEGNYANKEAAEESWESKFLKGLV